MFTCLCLQRGVFRRDQLLDRRNKLDCLFHYFLSLRFRGYISIVVVNHVSLAPTSITIISVPVRSLANRQPHGFEGDSVMSPSCRDSVTSTCNRHFCGLQSRIVSGGKPPVC